MTDGRTSDGGDCNIPDAFFKKRGDKYASKMKCIYAFSVYKMLVG